MRIRKISFLIAAVLCVCTGLAHSQGPVTNVKMPVIENAPAAFAGPGYGRSVRLRFTPDGKLALAHTDSEAKVWKMPEGTLIYRHQNGSKTNAPLDILSPGGPMILITNDGKYIYLSDKKEVADAETGELISGALFDSILNGSYDKARPGTANILAKAGSTNRTFALPVGFSSNMELIEQLSMVAVVSNLADQNFAITLHDVTTGAQILSLTDHDAARSFAAKFRSVQEGRWAAYQKEQEANRRGNEEYALKQAADAAAAYKRDMAAGAEHAKLWQTCPVCNGTRYTTKSGYSRGTSTTTEGTRQNTITGEKSTVRETTTTGGGAYTNYESCSRCGGKGEVRR